MGDAVSRRLSGDIDLMKKDDSHQLNFRHILLLLVAVALVAIAAVVPMFKLTVGDALYQPSLLKMMTGDISVAGVPVYYPTAAKVAGGLMLALLAAAVIITLRRLYNIASILGLAGLVSYVVSGIAVGGVINPALAAAGIERSVSRTYLSFTPYYYISILLLFTTAIIIYWLSGGESLAKRLFLISSCIAIASVLVITLYMIVIGMPAIVEIGPLKFLFGTTWAPTDSTNPQFGILPMILTSLCCTFLSVLIGVPVGILTAVFLAELAPKWLVKIVRPAVELLAGIPSVIYGFFAMQIISPFIKRAFNLPSGDTMLTATIVLAIMILPTIITTCETGLKAVPDMYREASLAMGASKIRTIFTVVLPAARSAILSGVILGVGRSIGETMAIIMVAGNSPNMPNLLGSVRPMTVGIVMEMSYASGLHRDSLFGIGLVLFVFIMIVNIIFMWLSKKGVQIDGKA